MTDASTPPSVLAWILAAGVLRWALAHWVTGYALVDDAYIHLRYARNLAQHGAFEYNLGEAVFGVTSPLFALACAGLVRAVGALDGLLAPAVILLNLCAWSALAWLVARDTARGARGPVLATLLLAPVFVDNQLLGMESALFALLVFGAGRAALAGRTAIAACWFGPALVTRPEAVLLAPWLVHAALSAHGAAGALRSMRQARFLIPLLAPGSAWATYALLHFGSVVPQSLVAKSGWNNAHYDELFGPSAALLALPRLTFLPFVDHMPLDTQRAISFATLAAIVVVGATAMSSRDRAARFWFGFYATYLGFYLLGKGATEASWYAVPSSVALLLAARPALARAADGLRRWERPALVSWSLALGLSSVVLAHLRAPLLRTYWDGYGRCAVALAAEPRLAPYSAHRVVIGEIGVFGFASPHAVTDIGALVSPEVLPWKNAGASFVEVVQRSGASAFVISQRALDTNDYPSLACTAADEPERRWLERCELVASFLDKRAYFVPASLRLDRSAP
ncbi:MAG: hypothetical protein R3F49_13780 [Planctomycetota bacterium]